MQELYLNITASKPFRR